MGKDQYTKNEHYVPRFYLDSFSNGDGKVWVYDRVCEKTFCKTSSSICVIKDLYETKAEELHPVLGKYILRNQIENTLCDCEGEWSLLLRKLLRVCRQNINRNALICSTDDRIKLAQFVSNLILRNPWTMVNAGLDDISEAMELEETKKYEKLFEKLGLGRIDSIIKFIQKSNHFNSEFGSQKLLTDSLCSLSVSFIYNEKNDFVTSSYPVYCGMRNGNYELTDVFVPLSTDILLYYGTRDKKQMRSNRLGYNSAFSDLMKFLYLFANTSDKARFIIAKDKESLNDVKSPEALLHRISNL